MPEETILIARVTGRVQGVWFRGWTQETAEALGLRGWVRNEADGSVAALIIGADDKVQAMVRALHDGPPAARVDDVAVLPGADDETVGFQILR